MDQALSVPGKTFLLGEYAVLAGKPALLAAVAPRFEFRKNPVGQTWKPHPDSPAGQLLRGKENLLGASEFMDPYQGAGGFGGSIAEFISAFSLIQPQAIQNRDWKMALRAYRQLFESNPLPPSGADLICQWNGGVLLWEPIEEKIVSLEEAFDWSLFLVFSATGQSGRKVATHEHLQTLQNMGFPNRCEQLIANLSNITRKGWDSIRANDVPGLGFCLTQYAEFLEREGLEHPLSREDRVVISQMPGVAGVKGSGAMLSDILLVLLTKECRAEGNVAKIVEFAENRGLKLVANGIKPQSGLMYV